MHDMACGRFVRRPQTNDAIVDSSNTVPHTRKFTSPITHPLSHRRDTSGVIKSNPLTSGEWNDVNTLKNMWFFRFLAMLSEDSDKRKSPIFSAADFADDDKRHVLLASSGSVATIKLPVIASALSRYPKVSMRIIITTSAENFLQGQSTEQPYLDALQDLPNVEAIYRDEDEWRKPWVRGDNILHIELRRWAHVLLVVPISANTLAKMTNGIADNLLTSVIRAWDIPGLFEAQSKAPPKWIFVAQP